MKASPRPDASLATALHEVSNALTVVLGWLDAAASAETLAQAREALAVARDHAARGHAVARAAIGDDPTEQERPRSSASLARDLVTGVTPEARRRQVRVEPVSPVADVLVPAPVELLQIVLNLLLNAVAFSPPGGVVRLSVELCPEGVRFAVTDQGPGIPPERAETLLASPVSTRRGGAGLGLRHSAALAESRGGELRLAYAGGGAGAAADARGPGARFELTWPVAEPPSSVRRGAPVLPPLAGCRIAVLDDDRAVRELLDLGLTARGAEVLTVADKDALAALLAGGALHAALVDLSPLGPDARAALDQLAAEAGPVHLVVISGSAAPAAAPVAAWVRKPFDVAEVVDALRGLLGTRSAPPP